MAMITTFHLFLKGAIVTIRSWILGVALTAAGVSAGAVQVTAELTVDNVYGLYVGTPATASLVGSNNDWISVESYIFQANPGDFVYVAAWDFGSFQSFQGYAQAQGGTRFRSNAVDWVYSVVPASALPGWSAIDGPQPGLASLRNALSTATWSTVAGLLPHDGAPWGAKVSDVATQWIWADTANPTSVTDGQMVVFRTASAIVSNVPEPSQAVMLALGLAVVVLLVRRHRAT